MVHTFVFCCQNTFFHEWASYERWGLHRTSKIHALTTPFFFVFIRTTHLTVCLKNYAFYNISDNYAFNRPSNNHPFNKMSDNNQFN